MIAFYLDEHLPDNLREASRLGLEVVSVSQRQARGWSDEAQLKLATEEGRAFVTRNYPDFALLAGEWARDNRSHPGIVLVPTSIEQDDAIGLLRGLARIAELYPDGLPPGAVMWLFVD